MDRRILENIFPLLKRSINYYLHIAEEGSDGKIHLPATLSPEYPAGPTPDCNYDLSLFRWGCETLIEICAILGREEPLIHTWKDTLERLADYPADENGFRIGRDVAFEKSHRHFSHLMMVYPLRLVAWEEEENRKLIERSVKHWMGLDEELQGYSYPASASMCALMGNGEAAVEYLLDGIDRHITANTMYLEDCYPYDRDDPNPESLHPQSPTMETPLMIANSLLEMLLQSSGGLIRVFPAIPESWREASFANLRAEGAFLVSASRSGGTTQWIRVESLAGGSCGIQSDFSDTQKVVIETAHGPRTPHHETACGGRTFDFDMEKAEVIVIRAENAVVPDMPEIVPPENSSSARRHHFGAKK